MSDFIVNAKGEDIKIDSVDVHGQEYPTRRMHQSFNIRDSDKIPGEPRDRHITQNNS